MKHAIVTHLTVLGSTYRSCAVRAAVSLWRNYAILVGSVALIVVYVQAAAFASLFGQVGGFIMGLAQLAALTLYFGWLSATIDKERVSFRGLLHFDYSIFWSALGAAFVLWLGDLVFRGTLQSSQALNWVPWVYSLAIFLLLNALPEVVYQQRYDSFPAITSAFQFSRDNWIEWYVPLVLILSPILFSDPGAVLPQLAGSYVLMPVMPVLEAFGSTINISKYLVPIFLILVGNWYMLFRGFLFKELINGDLRRKVYQQRTRG